MPEQYDAEIFGGGGGAKEGHEQSFEQFREDQRRTQQAMAQLFKEEGKVKAQDDKLAKIIVQFLNDPANTHLFLLIARCVSQNIPSEFIIVIISLIHQEAAQEVAGFLAAPAAGQTPAGGPAGETSALNVASPEGLHAIPPAVKGQIDGWTQKMNRVALKFPHRMLESVMQKTHGAQERQISDMVIQLSSVVLRDFLARQSITVEFQAIRDFMQLILVEIVKSVETLLHDQKALRDGRATSDSAGPTPDPGTAQTGS